MAESTFARALPRVGLVVAFVALSSWLGLTGRFFLFEPFNAVKFFVEIWAMSPVADAVFALGSALACVAGYRAARAVSPLAGGGVSLGLNWVVYALSFILLPSMEGVHSTEGGLRAIGGAFRFTGAWGAIGLAFCALAPPLAQRYFSSREARETPPPTPVPPHETLKPGP